MVTGGKTGGADNLCAMLGGDSSGHQCPQRRRDPIVTRIRLGQFINKPVDTSSQIVDNVTSEQRMCGN